LDKTDLDIMRMLLVNGRASYQNIGNQLHLSSNTVKNRVMKMIDNGTIDRFISQIKVQAFGYDLIYAIVSHGGEQQQSLLDKAKLLGHIFMVINCIGDLSVLGIAVRGELEQKMELVRKLFEPAIVINLFSVRAIPVNKLTHTDLMLIRHLIKFPRASAFDIAKAINISTRTVKRRLDLITRLDIIRFSILYNPVAMHGFIQFFLLLEIDEKRYKDVVSRIYRQLGDNFLLPPPPIYQKSMIVVILYTDNVNAMDEMFKIVKNVDGVKKVEMSIPTKLDFELSWFIMMIDKVLKKSRENNIIRRGNYILER